MSESYLMAYGTLVGKSHGEELPCQDYASCLERNGVSAIALSDGCGSSPISQHGSKATVEALLTLLTDNFDELIALKPIELRKLIVEAIIKGIDRVIEENKRLISEYKERRPIDAEESIARFGRKHFQRSLFNATALFAATKDGVWILGRIGDGEVGALIDGKMKVVLEEAKDGERNGTLYPSSISYLAEKNPDWYASNAFDVIKVRQFLQGVVLTSDGSDALLDRRTPFEEKYAKGLSVILDNLSALEDPSACQAYLQQEILPLLVKRSSTRDDCSIAILLKQGSKIEQFIVKEYPGHPGKGESRKKEAKKVAEKKRRHSGVNSRKVRNLLEILKREQKGKRTKKQ